MTGPIVAVGIFLGGWLAKMGYDRFVRGGPGALANPLAPLPGAAQNQLVTALTPGQMYTVVMMVDPKGALGHAPSSLLSPGDVSQISQTIGAGLAQVGLSPLADPVPGGKGAVPGDKPSQWDMIARWEGPGAMISARPGYVSQINFYLVPSAG